jgi:enoyl-CoA hydratase/carnithine racemase
VPVLERREASAHDFGVAMTPDAIDPESRASISQSDSVVWLTLTRPAKANAVDMAMVKELHRLLDDAEARDSARTLILSGEGRNFCGGADLAELAAGGADHLRIFLESFQAITHRLERSHLLTVAAVHGAARAGGLELALACDMVVAARSATFGDGHLANGLLPGGGSSARLPRCIGWNRAKWMILSAAAIGAELARDWGLVMEVFEEGSLREGALRLARSLAGTDPGTIRRAKALLATAGNQSLDANMKAEITTLEAHCHTEAMRSGIEAFLRK